MLEVVILMVEMSSSQVAKDMFIVYDSGIFIKYLQVDAMYVFVNCSDGVFPVYKSGTLPKFLSLLLLKCINLNLIAFITT